MAEIEIRDVIAVKESRKNNIKTIWKNHYKVSFWKSLEPSHGSLLLHKSVLGCFIKRNGYCQLTGNSDFTLKWLLPVNW